MATGDIARSDDAGGRDPAAGEEAGGAPPMVRTLDHVYYWVTDMDRSVAFYAGVLGLRQVRRDGASWAVFDVAGRSLALHGAVEGRPGRGAPGGAAVVFGVDDLDDACAVLEGRGVTFDHLGAVEGYARFAAFRDPDGNTLQLIEYATRPDGTRAGAGA